MTEAQAFNEAQAHRHFAIQFNNATWGLLDKKDRTREDDELMIVSAHASLRHWLEAGTGVNHQRGEWLIARVYSVLGLGDRALYHAQRCLELTEMHAAEMKDFDRAYAYEAVARANAVAGNREQAREYLGLAEAAGAEIAGPEDKAIFQGDLGAGEWGGLR